MRNRTVVIPFLLLALAALACALPLGTAADSALFKDDFAKSDSGWSTFSSTNGSVDYAGGEYVMTIARDKWFVWGNPGETTLSNVHIEVTAKNTSGVGDLSFGIMCNYADDTHYYYMGIDTQGNYAIAKTEGATETFLTNNDQWGQSDKIKTDASSYRLGADCGSDGKLTLYVDGQVIDTATDTTYTTGDVGLFGWTDATANAEVHFDDVVVTALK